MSVRRCSPDDFDLSICCHDLHNVERPAEGFSSFIKRLLTIKVNYSL